MILFLSEADVEKMLSMPLAVDIVEAAFRQQGEGRVKLLPRFSEMLPGTAGALRMISAVMHDNAFFGLKTLTGLPGKRLEDEVYFVLLLFDTTSGALRAIISANHLTGLRTGAASGVAARYFAKQDAPNLGVIGTGVQAWYQVQALCAVRNVQSLTVSSRSPGRADAFAARAEQQLGLKVRIVEEERLVVEDADLVVAATTATQPVVQAGWLRPGTHITAIGANTRTKRELDIDCFRIGHLVVDSLEQVLQETGDACDAVNAGVFKDRLPISELCDVVAGKKGGRQTEEEITIFKSVGIASQDVAVGAALFEQATKLNLGTWLEAG